MSIPLSMASLAMAATCLASPSLLHGLSLLVKIQMDLESGSLLDGDSDLTHLHIDSHGEFSDAKMMNVEPTEAFQLIGFIETHLACMNTLLASCKAVLSK